MTAPALTTRLMTIGERSEISPKRELKRSHENILEDLISLLNKTMQETEDHHHHQVTIVPQAVRKKKTVNHPDDPIVMILLTMVPMMMVEEGRKEVQEKEVPVRRMPTDQRPHPGQEDSMNLENIALSSYPRLTLIKLIVRLGLVNFIRTYV